MYTIPHTRMGALHVGLLFFALINEKNMHNVAQYSNRVCTTKIKRTKGALVGRQNTNLKENEKFLSLDAALSINNPP